MDKEITRIIYLLINKLRHSCEGSEVHKMTHTLCAPSIETTTTEASKQRTTLLLGKKGWGGVWNESPFCLFLCSSYFLNWSLHPAHGNRPLWWTPVVTVTVTELSISAVTLTWKSLRFAGCLLWTSPLPLHPRPQHHQIPLLRRRRDQPSNPPSIVGWTVDTST